MEQDKILKETVENILMDRKTKVGYISTSKLVENVMLDFK